jgi:hypothetical protein
LVGCLAVVDGYLLTELGIPRFWLLAFGNHPVLEQLLTAEDIPILESLVDLNVTYAEDYSSFSLHFKFLENQYFTNKA